MVEIDLADSADAFSNLRRWLVGERKRQHVTQAEMAKRLGVTQPVISQFEAEGSDPRLATVQRYARALGVPLKMSMWPLDDPYARYRHA